jgi:hypothetical protein
VAARRRTSDSGARRPPDGVPVCDAVLCKGVCFGVRFYRQSTA